MQAALPGQIDAVNILGVQISAINMVRAVETIAGWIANSDPHYVCVTPAHSVMAAQDDPQLRRIFNNSGLTTPDGMSIVWLLRMQGQSQVSRVYGPDLVLAVCERGLDEGWKHYFYGGEEGVAERLIERLQRRFKSLQVAGSHSPAFRVLSREEEQQEIEMIRTAKPDVLWVGLGTPKQDRWMARHIGLLDIPALIGVGAAFDFLSGNKRQAPLWMQRSGLEWMFRLVSEPGRLWRRYIRYPHFALLVTSQLLGLKRFESRAGSQ